jgi:hypothetical protein
VRTVEVALGRENHLHSRRRQQSSLFGGRRNTGTFSGEPTALTAVRPVPFELAISAVTDTGNDHHKFLIHSIASLKMQSFPNQYSVLPCPTLPRDAIV